MERPKPLLIEDRLLPGNPKKPVVNVLYRICGQGGADGYPYDEMQQAAEYIDQLEKYCDQLEKKLKIIAELIRISK